MSNNSNNNKNSSNKFLKQEFIKSDLYKSKKDLLATLLKDDSMYSKAEVDKILSKYLKEII